MVPLLLAVVLLSTFSSAAPGHDGAYFTPPRTQPGAQAQGPYFTPPRMQPPAEGPSPSGRGPFAMRANMGALDPAKAPAPLPHHPSPAVAATTATPSPVTAATTTATVTAAALATPTAATALNAREKHNDNAKPVVTEQCRLAYKKASEERSEEIDILPVLLQHDGMPGQLSGVTWRQFGNESRPDEWSYFYGNTDYRTFIRLEEGIVHSATAPAPGTQPEKIEGDIWWTTVDFCGKMHHAKYTQETSSAQTPGQKPQIVGKVVPEICRIGVSKLGEKMLYCSNILGDKTNPSPAVLATLIG